jgi:hypothetical protein
MSAPTTPGQAVLNYTYVVQMTATVCALCSQKIRVRCLFRLDQIMIWDIAIHIADDVELLSLPGRFQAPTVVHFLSRYATVLSKCFRDFIGEQISFVDILLRHICG